MKSLLVAFLIFSYVPASFADCRFPLITDLSVSLNARLSVDKKVGKKEDYIGAFPFTRLWQNEDNALVKVIQVPVVPLYVALDFLTLPISGVENGQTWFKNRGVDIKSWWFKDSGKFTQAETRKKAQMLKVILESYRGQGPLLKKVSKSIGKSVKETRIKIKMKNLMGFHLCKKPIGLDGLIKELK